MTRHLTAVRYSATHQDTPAQCIPFLGFTSAHDSSTRLMSTLGVTTAQLNTTLGVTADQTTAAHFIPLLGFTVVAD